MGRLIDADVLREEVYSWGMNDYEPSDFTDAIDDAPTVEATPKADYEARLKADMVALLEDLKLDIEYCVDAGEAMQPFEDGVNTAKNQVLSMVDERINALKENIDG